GSLQWASSFPGTNGTSDISSPTLNGRAPVTFSAGGATMDTNGNTITLANSIGNGGTGSLTKTGLGRLNLQGSNLYSGGTFINNGSLFVNNTAGSGTGSGSVTVNNGGTLGGIGTISGAVTVNSAGHIAPGTSVGTLTLGSLNLGSGSVEDFEFN